jgi:hypothetical protein
MFLGLPDPHPLVKGTDPRIRVRIRIRTKMSRIPNTDFYKELLISKHASRTPKKITRVELLVPTYKPWAFVVP